MRNAGIALFLLLAAIAARGESLLPLEDGSTWQYELVQEQGGPAASPPATAGVTVQVGRETFAGKEFIKLVTSTDDVVTKTELMTWDEHGWVCHYRGGRDGRMAKLDPPQTILPATVKPGDSWDTDGEVAGMEVQQHFVVGEPESVRVGEETLRAFRIHSEDSSVMSVKLDRWFFPGVGFVKEMTVVRGPTGGLLQRSTLQLQKRPEIIARPIQPTPTPTPIPAASPTPTAPMRGPEVAIAPEKPGKKLTVEVSTDPSGGSKSEFKSDAQNIYVRWHGHGLPDGARVRVAWIAEDVGDLVEPNFVVDETESVAPTADASARFTLGRPPDGWAEGKYRVEFYVNDELEETVHVTIVK